MQKRKTDDVALSFSCALARGYPVVLQMPEADPLPLSEIFGCGAQDLPRAPMTRLKDWVAGRHRTRQVYACVKTADWADFEQKLHRILEARQAGRLYLAYGGYLTAFGGVRDNGPFLYRGRDLFVEFPRVSLERDKNLTVRLPYFREDRTGSVYLYTSDQNDPVVYEDRFAFVNGS